MSARAIAGEWKLPLVKFDTSAIYDKFVGETEKHIRKMFIIAEQLAPAVLWIDELEKVFAGSGPDSASVDAGVSSRLLGSFLCWMQDRKAAVFVAATCNNVNALPPELIRTLRWHPVRLLSGLGSEYYYGAKKHALDKVAAAELARGGYDVFHGWSGECVRSLREARRLGIPSVIEIPTWHRNKGRDKPAP